MRDTEPAAGQKPGQAKGRRKAGTARKTGARGGSPPPRPPQPRQNRDPRYTSPPDHLLGFWHRMQRLEDNKNRKGRTSSRGSKAIRTPESQRCRSKNGPPK